MGKKKNRRRKGVLGAPRQKERRMSQKEAGNKDERKDFLTRVAGAKQCFAFLGNGQISYIGFAGAGDALLFLQDQVYSHRGGSIPTYMNIFQNMVQPPEAKDQAKDDPALKAALESLEEKENGAKEEGKAPEPTPSIEDRAEEVAKLKARLAALEEPPEPPPPADVPAAPATPSA